MTRLAILLAIAIALAAPAHAQTPIKIGFMAELSGPQGALGQDQYDAFMMVVEHNGGKLGGVPVQIIKEDSQLKPEVATQIVDKLIEKDKVPIITGITFSNVMMAVHKKITDKEVFLIGSNAGPAPIAGAQCSPYSFIVSWQNDNAGRGRRQVRDRQGLQARDRHGAQLPGRQGLHRRASSAIYKGEIDRRDLHAAQPARLLGRARAGRGEESRRGLRVLSRAASASTSCASTSRPDCWARCRCCRRRRPTARRCRRRRTTRSA